MIQLMKSLNKRLQKETIKQVLPYQTPPFYECVGYRAPTFQLVIHLQKQQQGDLSLGCVA